MSDRRPTSRRDFIKLATGSAELVAAADVYDGRLVRVREA